MDSDWTNSTWAPKRMAARDLAGWVLVINERIKKQQGGDVEIGPAAWADMVELAETIMKPFGGRETTSFCERK